MRHIPPFSTALFNELNDIINTGLRAFETETDQLFAGYPNSRHQLFTTENGWAARVDLPGYTKEDINLQFEDKALTLKADNESRGSRQLRIPLGNEVQADKITAKLENGILEITLPKKEATEPKSNSIEIS